MNKVYDCPVDRSRRRIPEATVSRLSVYLRALDDLGSTQSTISSEQLAELAGVNAAKVRKDLSHVGSYGTRGVGYEVQYLRFNIRQVLGQTEDCPVVIAGAGNLGRALANYGGFGQRGFPIVAIVDVDPEKIGMKIGDVTVIGPESLGSLIADMEPVVGVIATPAGVAQAVGDQLVEAGVASILNFAPAVVTVPDGIPLRKVDLALELQILSFYQREAVDGS